MSRVCEVAQMAISDPESNPSTVSATKPAPAAVPGPSGSGPTAPYSSHTQPISGTLQGSSFEQLCNGGWRWMLANCCVKLLRLLQYPLRQVYLLPLAWTVPTNHLMLTWRTYPHDMGEANCNKDHLAAAFRDELMLVRGWLHRQRSPLISLGRWLMELPFFGVPGIVQFLNLRTQWFDEGVTTAMDAGIKQVVIIAAGFDTRAYRLGRPGVSFYEVDMPHASTKKQDLVRRLLPASKYPRPEYVAADLSKVRLADALASTSFNPQQPALFVVEGLVYYLPPTAVEQLLSCVGQISAPGSRLMLDFVHLSSLSGSVWHPGLESSCIAVANKGESWKSGFDERPEAVGALMQLFGFDGVELLTARDMVERFAPGAPYRSHPPSIPPYFGYIAAGKQ